MQATTRVASGALSTVPSLAVAELGVVRRFLAFFDDQPQDFPMNTIICATVACACFLTTGSVLAGEVSTKPLRLSQGGTAEKPAIFDGKGIVIDLGVEVTDHAWKKDGEVWTSTAPLSGAKPMAAGQFTGLFVDEVPITIARDGAASRAIPYSKGHRYANPSALQPGQMGCTEQGLIYFRWPKGKLPGKARIFVPPKAGVSCVTIACSHIIVRNVTAMHAANDGFNIHGPWVGIRLENVWALSNADEGVSAHEEVQMDVDGAEIAWNGSFDAGVADVGKSTTSYKNCRVHDNVGAAFKFFGQSHSVTDTLIYNQAKDFNVAEGTKFRQERIERR
jgi:hypothetical protein